MSELRKDLVSGEWVILAPHRASRPHDVKKTSPKRKVAPLNKCPFEDFKKSGNGDPLLSWPHDGKKKVFLIPNKYPALTHGAHCAASRSKGPYEYMDGAGVHDLVVTKDHFLNFPKLSVHDAAGVFEIMRERMRALEKDKCLVYTSIFQCWGPDAGASIYHPHYQMLTMPILPPDVNRSLHESELYFRRRKRCIHCDIIAFESKGNSRVIFKNPLAIAFAPYASRSPYEVKILPRKHFARFEKTPSKVLRATAEILQKTLRALEYNLSDPDYNFFIHTSPLDASSPHYHWHIEVIPKVTVLGGLEWSTGVDVNITDPDQAAKVLRVKK